MIDTEKSSLVTITGESKPLIYYQELRYQNLIPMTVKSHLLGMVEQIEPLLPLVGIRLSRFIWITNQRIKTMKRMS